MLTGSRIVRELFDAALAAVEPRAALTRALAAHAAPASGPHIIAVGKAATAMAEAAAAALAADGLHPAGGIVVAAEGAPRSVGPLSYLSGDHPIPGPGSFAAADAVGRAVRAVGADEECWVLLSGGASSLIAAPVPEVVPGQLVELFGELMRSGLPIGEVNAVRRRVLRWGGGRLASALAARRIRVFAISDVPGDVPGDIGSGPCAADPGSASDSRVSFEIVARNADAIAGAERRAGELGIRARLGAPLAGEARDVGEQLARDLIALHARQLTAERLEPECIIRGGETVVSLAAPCGTGGRSQELALSAARELDGTRGITLLAAGTDGRDGPTDAAGAIVDGGNVEPRRVGRPRPGGRAGAT